MRSLAAGNPFARNDAALFYRQAKFMEDFSDDYRGFAQFSMYYPYYQHMGYEQLRTYFTWRTKARQGDIRQTSLSYVFLYIYELLSDVGADNASDGADRLMALWNGYREYEFALDRYLPMWLKDYHIYYELPYSFSDFVHGHELRGYYPELFLFDAGAGDRLALWNSLSFYNITKSRFYADGNEALLSGCFERVLDAVDELCRSQNTRIETVFSLGVDAAFVWRPFQRALFHNWLIQPDRTVEIPGGGIYSCVDNRWTANTIIHETKRKELIGYLLKKAEACLRCAVKYKYKITVNPGIFVYDFKKTGIPFDEFDRTVEKAVSEFYRDLSRTVVNVNPDNLAVIRSEALGTRDKLTVPEEAAPPAPALVFPPETTLSDSEGWDGFKDALSAAEREALSILLHGDMGVKAYADENGVMLEVLMDSINEKAADFIGDNILEINGDLTIFDEYMERIAEIVR